MSNPCHHRCDWTDESDTTDEGCCAPYPVRITCDAPVIPSPDCDEEEPTIQYDEETEEFSVLTIMYDSHCSALLDSTGSALISKIS